MAELSSTAGAFVATSGAGLAGYLASANAEAAVGALCGALLYFAASQELRLGKRILYFVISFIMGYLWAPALAKAEMFGVGPIDLPGPAAFVSAALVVVVTLAAIRSRAQAAPREG